MSTVSRTRRPEKPPLAVRPDWRWHNLPLWPCEILPVGAPGLLEIAGTYYSVIIHGHLPRHGEPVTTGVRLVKEGGQTYDIDLSDPRGFFSCDCPDGTYRPGRPGGCKHIVAVREALPAPDRPKPCCKQCREHDEALRSREPLTAA